MGDERTSTQSAFSCGEGSPNVLRQTSPSTMELAPARHARQFGLAFGAAQKLRRRRKPDGRSSLRKSARKSANSRKGDRARRMGAVQFHGEPPFAFEHALGP